MPFEWFPGNINTELQRYMPKLAHAFLVRSAAQEEHLELTSRSQRTFLLFDVSYGALTQLWAATSKEGANLNGKVCASKSLFQISFVFFLFPFSVALFL